MKEKSPNFISFNPRVLLGTPLFFLFLIAPVVLSAAQSPQDNRQLVKESKNTAHRLALVIGNGAYQTSKLRNPPNDATAIAVVLRDLGFDVMSGVNKSQREMKRMIREFGQRLRVTGGVGLFYFAGHGVQAKGRNYLIPVDADIQAEADLEDQAVDANYVLNFMDDAQSSLNIVILDACRNNPFMRSFRSMQEGLAQVRAPTGTLIAYATAPDSLATDGVGVNSPYTEELIKEIRVPGVLVETMFRRVTEQVSSRTMGRQEPWFSANVKGDFYFNGAHALVTSSDPDGEFWSAIKNSKNVGDYKAYLDAFPKGRHAAIAQNVLRRLQDSQTASIDPGNEKGSTGNLATSKVGNLAGPMSNGANTDKSQSATHASEFKVEYRKGGFSNPAGTLYISPAGVEFKDKNNKPSNNFSFACSEVVKIAQMKRLGISYGVLEIRTRTKEYKTAFQTNEQFKQAMKAVLDVCRIQQN